MARTAKRTRVKPARSLTFHDRLSQLTLEQASKLLGREGRGLIMAGSKWEVDLNGDAQLGKEIFRVLLRRGGRLAATVTLMMPSDWRVRLAWHCSECSKPCEHAGAAFSTLLEHKAHFGLAAAPPEQKAARTLNDDEAAARALAERKERARLERMTIKGGDPKSPWADYSVTSLVSGKTYRVALRGLEPGQSYCTCPDFRTNTLGTCKHVLKVAGVVKRKFSARQLKKPYVPDRIAVHLHYANDVTLRMIAPANLPPAIDDIVRPLLGAPITDLRKLLRRLKQLEARGTQYHIFPDAEEYIEQQLHAERIRDLVWEIRRNPSKHPLRETLLKAPLLPYQLDGIAFAVGAGRAVLADDMGLGKTIQSVGVAEMLAREASVRRVLVICPASLKAQWRSEIRRFCDRDVQLVDGRTAQRLAQYEQPSFFTVCNYEQVVRDIEAIEKQAWDLIVLDEGQRIKNWESKTSRVIKGLKSRFALVLSGTPLENRLDELYSVVQFIDDRRLGPRFRFFNTHRIVDAKGNVLGYKNLDKLREQLAPVLLRRTRESVRLELPERTTEIVRITPSDEQAAIHDVHMQKVASIVRKSHLTEMDLLRLRAALLMCRMAADATYLVTKETPNHSTKLERLGELFDDIENEADRKVVLFTEWTSMLDLIEPLLRKRKMPFVRLDGSVPKAAREELVEKFQRDPECRFFLATNAGSVGLNLQAANTVINVDLPWNPAVLEQRIARAHRMGQTQPVQVFVLVTEQTLEENLLATLSAKRDLALAALDAESDVDTVELRSGAEGLRARLEVLLGAREAAPSISTNATERDSTKGEAHRQLVAEAGGQLLGAAFHFLDQLVSGNGQAPAPPEPMVREVRTQLESCIEEDAAGRPRLTFTLPDRAAIDQLSQTLARLLAAGKG